MKIIMMSFLVSPKISSKIFAEEIRVLLVAKNGVLSEDNVDLNGVNAEDSKKDLWSIKKNL